MSRQSFAKPVFDAQFNQKIIEEKTVKQLDGPYHSVWPALPVIHEETFDFVAAREMGIVTEEEEKRLKSKSMRGNFYFNVTAMLRRLPIEVGKLILQFVLQNKSLKDAIFNFKVAQLCSNFRKYRNFKGFEKVWNSFMELRENTQTLCRVVIYDTPSWQMNHYGDDDNLLEKMKEEMESRLSEEETGHSASCIVAYSLVNWMTLGRVEAEWKKREGRVYCKWLFETELDEFDEPEEDENSMGSDWRDWTESEEEEESTEGSTKSSEHESEGSIKSAEEEEEEEEEERSTEFTEEKNMAS